MKAYSLVQVQILYFLCTSMVSLAGYPEVQTFEWMAVADDTPGATSGWELSGNFYVIVEYYSALPKFGVSTAISPRFQYDWATSQIYQSYV